VTRESRNGPNGTTTTTATAHHLHSSLVNSGKSLLLSELLATDEMEIGSATVADDGNDGGVKKQKQQDDEQQHIEEQTMRGNEPFGLNDETSHGSPSSTTSSSSNQSRSVWGFSYKRIRLYTVLVWGPKVSETKLYIRLH